MTESNLLVDVQDALTDDDSEKPPSPAQLQKWAELAYAQVADQPSELTLRLVEASEMLDLNSRYRGKQRVTNVLSFPIENDFELTIDLAVTESDCSDGAPLSLLGDVVICHSVIQQEAVEQKKTLENHYAHMVTHGVLHLCGYDHIDDADALTMEALEVKILAHSSIENPYN